MNPLVYFIPPKYRGIGFMNTCTYYIKKGNKAFKEKKFDLAAQYYNTAKSMIEEIIKIRKTNPKKEESWIGDWIKTLLSVE